MRCAIMITRYNCKHKGGVNMQFKLERGDVCKTVDGKILKVIRTSENYIYGQNITDNVNFMSDRRELDNKVSEVYYV